jgi:hypothetical protein
MASLRDRIAAVLQLKKEFQPTETSSVGSAAPAAQQLARASRPAAWLQQPDPTLIGKAQSHEWLLPCVFAALLVLGGLTATRGWQQIAHAKISAAWPYARGVIVSSEVESYASSEGMRWRPAITYMYRVGKREVVGTQLRLVEAVSAFDEADARAYAERYRLHGEVLVYYNPDRVNESVLDLSAPRSAYLSVYLGLSLAVVSAILLLMSLRAGGRREHALSSNELAQSH